MVFLPAVTDLMFLRAGTDIFIHGDDVFSFTYCCICPDNVTLCSELPDKTFLAVLINATGNGGGPIFLLSKNGTEIYAAWISTSCLPFSVACPLITKCRNISL